jgi:hypothetical protein
MALVIVGHGAGADLLHRQPRLGAIQRLNLALLIDRQHDGWSGGLTYRPTISLSLAANCGSLDSLKRHTRWGLSPWARHIRCTELTLIPAALAMAEPVQWLATAGGPASVMATTRSITSGPSGCRTQQFGKFCPTIRDNPSSLKDKYAFTITQTFNAVRDNDDGGTRSSSEQSVQKNMLAFDVDRACCFVEHEKPRAT